jgi:hypothetical protein
MYRCQQENLGGRRDLFPILTPLESGKPTVLTVGTAPPLWLFA